MKPLTTEDAVSALQQKRPTSCPYCGHQEFRLHTKTDDGGSEVLAVYAMPEMKVSEDPASVNSFKASISIGPDKSLPVVAMQCVQCGHIDLFSYWFLFNKAKENV